MKQELTQVILKELLYYNDQTGLFTWKPRARSMFTSNRGFNIWNSRYPGATAGSISGDGYWSIAINNIKYKAHRLAFLYFHGIMPKYIDHIDHDRVNNRIVNLRGVTHKENCRNQNMNKNNTSGVTGVYWRNDIRKWAAQIMVDGICHPLGTSIDKEEAVKLRKEAEHFYNFHNNHGVSA